MLGIRSVLAAVAVTLALPAGAAASTYTLQGDTVVVRAAAGETNRIAVGFDMVFSDTAGATPLDGCTAVSATQVECGTDWRRIDVDLGDGNDQFDSGGNLRDNVIAAGGPGDDKINFFNQTPGTIDGGDGNDTLYARWDRQTITGGAGNDDLTGGGDNDTLDGGPGIDSIQGDDPADASESGNDIILVRDGERDMVGCGFGADVVTADAVDVTDFDCEAVDKPAPPATGGTGDTGGTGGDGGADQPPAADATVCAKAKAAVAKAKKKLRKAKRSGKKAAIRKATKRYKKAKKRRGLACGQS